MTLIMSLKLFLCRIQFKDDIVISSPDVSLVELGPDVEFVLLATDGLWDYIKRSIQVPFIFTCSFFFLSKHCTNSLQSLKVRCSDM
jgi:serine/threonine protein phosphatase PrpC